MAHTLVSNRNQAAVTGTGVVDMAAADPHIVVQYAQVLTMIAQASTFTSFSYTVEISMDDGTTWTTLVAAITTNGTVTEFAVPGNCWIRVNMGAITATIPVGGLRIDSKVYPSGDQA